MSSSALDLKDYVEQKDLVHRYGRQDFIYATLDKRIDLVREEVKELRSDVKELRSDMKEFRSDMKELRTEMLGEIGKTNQRIDGLFSQMVSMKTWGIGLAITILLGIAGLFVTIILSL